MVILQPLCATLPSPEAGDARLCGATRPFGFSPDSGQTSPSMQASALGTFGPNVNAVLLGDMENRALKSLYSPSTNTYGETPSHCTRLTTITSS